MIEYMLGVLAALAAYRHVKFYFIRRRRRDNVPIMEGFEPIYHKGNRIGVLLIHGFTSGPADLVVLATRLKKEGYSVYVPLLPGHGTDPDRLNLVKWHQWIDSLDAAYDVLSKDCDKIIVGGSSMGANLSLLMAKRKKIVGVIAMGTVIKYRRHRLWRLLASLLRSFKLKQKKHYPRHLKFNKHFNHNLAYSYIPLVALREYHKVIKKSYEELNHVRTPVLVLHAKNDLVADPNSARIVYDGVSSKIKDLKFYKNTWHTILADVKKYEVCDDVISFIKKVI